MTAVAHRPPPHLWAITSYFNPMRSRRRRANYRTFRAHLTLPLVAVELAYSADFELAEGEADVLIQLRGGDVMWQKERLLNVALRAVPASCRKVVWIDCDMVFEAADWADRLDALLERNPLVQAFNQIHYQPADWTPGAAATSPLFTQPAVQALVTTIDTDPLASHIAIGPGASSKGGAWAARRELLEVHGLYDACIIGGGDLALAAAVHGRFDVATRTMNDRQAEHYLQWARPWHDRLAGQASVLDGALSHLWHGEFGDRRYRQRHEGLRPFAFDPFEDLALDHNGAWRWNTDKPAMHAYVLAYFASRREDGGAQ
ncbi:MAG: hypothetical protein ACRERC_23040 [Candidatus Binatia bacterium]